MGVKMSTTDIRSTRVDGTGVIYPGQYLNQLRGERMERQCMEMLATGVRKVVINFEETELVNSIGISLLLGVIEAVDEANGSVVITNLNSANRELFQVLGILSKVQTEGIGDVAL